MSDSAFPAVFPAIVSTWRAAKVRELREHAAKVRAAYTWPAATVYTFAYADAIDRAAGALEADPALQDSLRLAARAMADVVARDPEDGTALLRTSTGEWGVRDPHAVIDGVPEEETVWKSGENAERKARERYAELRGLTLCQCGVEVDAEGDVCSHVAAGDG